MNRHWLHSMSWVRRSDMMGGVVVNVDQALAQSMETAG